MRPKSIVNFLTLGIMLILGLWFVIKFAGPNLLKQYISYGIGDCKDIPILCMEPEEKIIRLQESQEDYILTLVPQEFTRMAVACPKGFTIVQELIKKPFYKKNKWLDKGAAIYLLHQEPGAFLRLYPDVRKQGINDNYEFLRRLNFANLNKVKNLTDAFFLIMKSVFTPDIGNQPSAKMIRFQMRGKKGFINYNLLLPDNYFDCNIIDSRDNFYKVYIKDRGARLDLNKVFAILSTIKPLE
ncbi:MAG: hypothetical protein WC616_02500 [Candidatus Omnitrophota bacterium]